MDGLGTNIVSVFYTQEKSLEFSKLTQQLDLRKDRVDLEYHEQLTGDLAADGKAGEIYLRFINDFHLKCLIFRK